MRRIRDFPLATYRLGLWRLGHASLVVRVADGPAIAVDPYLTDAAAASWPRMRRRFSPPFPPERLDTELVLVTHTHADHLDPLTIGPSPARTAGRWLGPGSVATGLAKAGVPADRILRLDAGQAWAENGVEIRATRAFHSPDVPDAVGFLLRVAGGPNVWITGDTLLDPALGVDAAGAHALVVPINGKLGNLGVKDATTLVARLKPRFAVPSHHDLIAANGEDPEAFLLHLEMEGHEERYAPLAVMQPLLLAADGTGVRVTRQLEMVWDAGKPIRDITLPAGYRLRAFRESDIESLGEIYRLTFGPGHDAAWWRREFASAACFSPGRVMVIEESSGRPVATALAWEDEARAHHGQGVLHFVATHPDHHRRGLGKAVSAAVLRWFKKDARAGVFLLTDDERIGAVKAYLTLGFEPVAPDDEMKGRWANWHAWMAAHAAEGGAA